MAIATLLVAGAFLLAGCEKEKNTNISSFPLKASLCKPDTVYTEGDYTGFVNNVCSGAGNECLPEVVVEIRRDGPCEEMNVVNSLENASQSDKRSIISQKSDFFVNILGEAVYVDYVINMIYNLDLYIVSHFNEEVVYHFVFSDNTVFPESLAFVIPISIHNIHN